MSEDLLIPVTQEAVKHGMTVGIKVYRDKLSFPDKFKFGGANELQADIYGFIAETVVCDYFKQPIPELMKGKLDEFDLILKDLRVDVKKVGYERFSKRTKITLNKKQFDRKKDKIDAFLFCTFKGSFTQLEAGVGKHQVFIPTPNMGKLWLIGWIKSEDVEKKAKPFTWPNGDEAWKLTEKDLNPIQELIE